jgi:Protein of unknown function (DUF742)
MDHGGPEPSRVRPFLPDEPVPDDRPVQVPAQEVSYLRPYLLTGGRSRPAAETLEIEAQVVTTSAGLVAIDTTEYEPREILMLCRVPLAVAEVAARLRLHLGVARVLVGDLLVLGHLAIRRPEALPHRKVDILERVIRGLQAID